MLLLLIFSFLSGLVTIFAPCIWPLLPIILSASATGGRRKPLGLVVGIGVSFTLFTLSLSYIVRIIPFDPDHLRLFAVVVIGFLGAVLLIPPLGRMMEGWVSRLTSWSGRFLPTGGGSGFGSGFLTGFFLGLVWSPCAGPILATVATLAATQAVNLQVILITVAFVSGVCVPLFFLSLSSQKILTRTRALSPYTGLIQKAFGVVMILAALAIYTGYDRTLQTKLLDIFPTYGSFLTQFDQNESVRKALESLRSSDQSGSGETKSSFLEDVRRGVERQGQAPEIQGIATWLNTNGQPLSLQELRGKVVLIDFWTYSCINCIRTLPYVTSWYEKYKDQGLVVIGVHSPEFVFERKVQNVEEAIARYQIHYPVALDNDFATWQAYDNHYWPAHYLIDAEGFIRDTHFGEGKYEETEKKIQALLEEAGQADVNQALTTEKSTPIRFSQTPETYLGAARIERFDSPEALQSNEAMYSLPKNLSLDHFALDGRWKIESERSLSGAPAALDLHFKAKKVFLVLSPAVGQAVSRVNVLLDGDRVEVWAAGSDVQDGVLMLDTERLYELIHFPDGASQEHTLRLEFETPGVAAYAFTFEG